MANDRIFLVCRRCHDSVMLAKFWPLGGFFGGVNAYSVGLADFVKKHVEECRCNNAGLPDLAGDAGLEIITESSERMHGYRRADDGKGYRPMFDDDQPGLGEPDQPPPDGADENGFYPNEEPLP